MFSENPIAGIEGPYQSFLHNLKLRFKIRMLLSPQYEKLHSSVYVFERGRNITTQTSYANENDANSQPHADLFRVVEL
jgi:hypothetical protein